MLFLLFLRSHFSIFRRDFPLPPRLFNDTDEDVFHRKTPFPGADHMDSIRFEFFRDRPYAALGVLVRDDVKPLAEKRNAPTLHILSQQVRRALGMVDDELQQMAGLLALESARAPFCHHL